MVAPHPDDESIGCGALLSASSRLGRRIHIVVISDGVGSHPGSQDYPPRRLRRVREFETVCAARRLGLRREDVTFLGLPDRHVPSCGWRAETARAAIVSAARRVGADALFVTWGHDPHCDHQASRAIAGAAVHALPGVRLYSFPVWGWKLDVATAERSPSDPPLPNLGPPRGCRLSAHGVARQKRLAIEQHRSQTGRLIRDDPTGFCLPRQMIDRATMDDELYFAEAGRVAA